MISNHFPWQTGVRIATVAVALALAIQFLSTRATAQRLASLLPVIKSGHVRSFRDQSWCRMIAYDGEAFAESTHPSTCVLFEGQPSAFTPASRAAFERVRASVRGQWAGVLWFSVAYTSTGDIATAEFSVNTLPFSGYKTYVYEPGYVLPENDWEMTYTAIDRDWYVREEEWM